MLLESASAWLAPGSLWPEPEPALSSQLPPLPPKACSPHSGQRAAVSTESGSVPPLPTALQGFHLPDGKRPGLLPALPASVSPLLSLLCPHGPPGCSSNLPGPVLPQGLCTGCVLCLGCPYPSSLHNWFLFTLQVSAQMSGPQTVPT